MSKVLVTGGAGFIGFHVTKKLIERNDQVTIIDDFNDRYDPRLKEARAELLSQTKTPPQIIRGDIVNTKLVEETFSDNNFDQVLHLAAWAAVPMSIDRPHIYTSANVDGTVNILEAARKNKIKNIVFASSSSVYGGITKMPFRETDDVSRPISPYAATKAAGEIMCATWHHLYQIPITCLRFFTVYGPWGRPEMAIFRFAKAIITDDVLEMRGHQTMRDFTYIDDIVSGIVSSLDKPKEFSIYNLGNHDAVLLPRLIKAIEDTLQKKARVKEVPLPASDLPATLADITKAQKELGYRPQTSIEEGVKKFADWYLDWYVPRFIK
jgi:UDP-glucuronate 4-epimerase